MYLHLPCHIQQTLYTCIYIHTYIYLLTCIYIWIMRSAAYLWMLQIQLCKFFLYRSSILKRQQSLQLCIDIIFSGHLKTYVTEDQMHMEPGGIARLCLRVGKYTVHILWLWTLHPWILLSIPSSYCVHAEEEVSLYWTHCTLECNVTCACAAVMCLWF